MIDSEGVLTGPPEEKEGDNGVAGGGDTAEPLVESDLSDAPPLDDDTDVEEDGLVDP